MRVFWVTLCLLGLVTGAVVRAADDPVPDPSQALTLRDALALALEHSPDLEAFSWEIRARDAHAVQAGRLPNPELRTEVENIGGSGSRQAFEQTETTVRLAQLIELGGKRGKRQQLAQLSSALATWDYEAKRLHVLNETSKAFVEALVAQERVALAAELEQVSRRALNAVDAQIAAGGASPVSGMRTQLAVDKADLERRRADQELLAARITLAATWGSDDPGFARLAGDLARIQPPPPVRDLVDRLEANPDVARWKTELDERRAALHLEQAGRVPDVTVGAGGRHFSDNGDNAIVFELSIPLPVFDRNDGAIAEAESRLSKANAERSAAVVSAHTALAATSARLAAAYERAERLRAIVIPQATRTLDQTLDTYQKGVVGYLEVLDAQRSLFDLRAEYLTALESYHLLAADVEQLTAAPLTPATTDGDTR
ncbi:MAG TPA: TolC family protein [Candidatus Binatia bacterium]|jgi:cobalt-zinc-cadmium efflux system outer membrane protein|nr:TolC family protein [Candidatus Binatia bacterium]